MAPGRRTHRLRASLTRSRVVAIAFVISGAGATSCILADPPAQPITLPPEEPRILAEEVSPPTSMVLGEFPDLFSVPVAVSTATTTFYWSLYIDYDPLGSAPFGLASSGQSTPDPSSPTPLVRTIQIESLAPPTFGCHTIQFIVSLQFIGSDGLGQHTPSSAGNDSITWFYNPTGDLSGCALYDAGVLDAGDAGGE